MKSDIELYPYVERCSVITIIVHDHSGNLYNRLVQCTLSNCFTDFHHDWVVINYTPSEQ
jgi:hypothetical protein